MRIPIIMGTQEKLKMDLMIGIDWCPNCQKFTETHIGRRVKVKHLNYIPLSSDVLEYFLLCSDCQYGSSLKKDQYDNIAHIFQPFSKRRDQIKCFQKAAEMAANLEPNQVSVHSLMTALSKEFPVSATPQLDGEYRRRFMRLLLVHGKGGSPAALNQPLQTAPLQVPQAPQNPNPPQAKAPVEMDTI